MSPLDLRIIGITSTYAPSGRGGKMSSKTAIAWKTNAQGLPLTEDEINALAARVDAGEVIDLRENPHHPRHAEYMAGMAERGK